MKKFGKLRIAVLCLLAALVTVVGGYAAYVCIAYYRLPDNIALEISSGSTEHPSAGQTYTVMSWNVGFGAYSADYSFFMDGGTESRAYSADAVRENISGVLTQLLEENPDFLLLQEVDVAATRSWHVDECAILTEGVPGYTDVFAQNYDSPYLFYPLTEPHGKSLSGMLTCAKFEAASAVRRSLPVESGFRKFLDLDRCYSVTRIPTEEGTLCLYNVHLSAYTADGTVTQAQLALLMADMAAEYAAGNYVLCGGDFNMDLLQDSGRIYGVDGGAYTWARPFPTASLPEGLQLVSAAPEYDGGVPSCRNADMPYTPGSTFVLTVDGFVVSDNIDIQAAQVVDTGFAYSDHNPVKLIFTLQ